MIQSIIKPTVIRLSRMRRRYRAQGMETGLPYYVIGYDMKRLIVTKASRNADRAYLVDWGDAELMRSEFVAGSSGSALSRKDVLALRGTLKKLAASIPSLPSMNKKA